MNAAAFLSLLRSWWQMIQQQTAVGLSPRLESQHWSRGDACPPPPKAAGLWPFSEPGWDFPNPPELRAWPQTSRSIWELVGNEEVSAPPPQAPRASIFILTRFLCMEKTLERPLDTKEIKPIHPKGNQPWIFIGRTDAEAEAPIPWPSDAKSRLVGKDWCWERLKTGEGDKRGWDGWMASLTQWTWVWASSGSWWQTGKPGMLQSMESQRVRHDLATAHQQLWALKRKALVQGSGGGALLNVMTAV